MKLFVALTIAGTDAQFGGLSDIGLDTLFGGSGTFSSSDYADYGTFDANNMPPPPDTIPEEPRGARIRGKEEVADVVEDDYGDYASLEGFGDYENGFGDYANYAEDNYGFGDYGDAFGGYDTYADDSFPADYDAADYEAADYEAADYEATDYDNSDYDAGSFGDYAEYNAAVEEAAATEEAVFVEASAVEPAAVVAPAPVETAPVESSRPDAPSTNAGREFEADTIGGQNIADDGTAATRSCLTCKITDLADFGTCSSKSCMGLNPDAVEDTRDYCLIEIRTTNGVFNELEMRCAEPQDCISGFMGNVRGVDPTRHDNCRPDKDDTGVATAHYTGRWANTQSVCRNCAVMNNGGNAAAAYNIQVDAATIKMFDKSGATIKDVSNNDNMITWSREMWHGGEPNMAYEKQNA